MTPPSRRNRRPRGQDVGQHHGRHPPQVDAVSPAKGAALDPRSSPVPPSDGFLPTSQTGSQGALNPRHPLHRWRQLCPAAASGGDEEREQGEEGVAGRLGFCPCRLGGGDRRSGWGVCFRVFCSFASFNKALVLLTLFFDPFTWKLQPHLSEPSQAE
jgi:hypothetical protein